MCQTLCVLYVLNRFILTLVGNRSHSYPHFTDEVTEVTLIILFMAELGYELRQSVYLTRCYTAFQVHGNANHAAPSKLTLLVPRQTVPMA